MAREEQPREDLLAEATGLVERISLRLRTGSDAGTGDNESEIVAGFRRDGSLAVFFGQQRVYQFTSTGSLRRAYLHELLYKAQAGVLITMRRERTVGSVNLLSTPLDSHGTREFLSQMHSRLAGLQQAIESREYEVLGQVPADRDILARLLDWLAAHGSTITIASSPRSA